MKETLTKILFGKEACFFINAKNPKVVKVLELDRERSAVEITFEAETTQSLCECGCGFEVGSLGFIRLHVESEEEAERRDINFQEYEERFYKSDIEN